MTRKHRFFSDGASTSQAATAEERHALLRRAILLSAISVAWNGVAGGFAAVLATATGSLSLFGFGVDAAIDSVASVALIWRFRDERANPARATRVERLAERIVGGVLVTAAVALSVGAARSLLAHGEVEFSVGVLVVLIASIVVLPPLAIAKRHVARDLRSGALRADAFLTAAAALLAGVSLAGVVAATLMGLWWADAVGALIIAAILAREGWTSVRLSEGADVPL
ncbi:MAG TPA: cation transporter [Candidatus Limnocylindrales bacterium]|nr:cation transporter [Candidatus Limnocylindrales bacterium]